MLCILLLKNVVKGCASLVLVHATFDIAFWTAVYIGSFPTTTFTSDLISEARRKSGLSVTKRNSGSKHVRFMAMVE